MSVVFCVLCVVCKNLKIVTEIILYNNSILQQWTTDDVTLAF
jgi:hypothetical protein